MLSVPVAGCLDGARNPVTAATPDGGGVPPAPGDVSLDVLGRECGEGRDDATIDRAGGEVIVEGFIAGRDSCDTAVARVSIETGTLVVTVEVVEAPTTESAECLECLTDISYRLTVEFPGGTPATVRVVHRSANGEVTVATV